MQFKLFYRRNSLVCNLVLAALCLISVISLVFVGQLKEREHQALVAEKEARKAEKKAKDSLEAFLEEQKKNSVLVDGIDVNRLVRTGNSDYMHMRLEKAQDLARAALLLEPDSEGANTLYGKTLCLQQKFREALPYLLKSDRDSKASLLPICQHYIDSEVPLSYQQLLDIMKDTPKRFEAAGVRYPTHHYSWNRVGYDIVQFMAYALDKFVPLEESELLIKKILEFENPDAEINIELTKSADGKLHVDVSKSKGLLFTYILTYINIESLNLGDLIIHHRKPLFKKDLSRSESLKVVKLSKENSALIEALNRAEIKVILD